ncbi:transcription initiation factor TFIID subunit 1-like [Drosophila gunungcola]|uniref:transcription initiation factor TFIID subunit 1-like n=1 Tax=Drosophila gunungcola TaxID=103775 RepID=UPI0022E1E375|nr:transcription initiation factor TFIID subunit 1-like [Drosophila gunungcola]
MKYLFVVALIALTIQLAYSATGTSTTTTAATTTTTTTTAATATTTTASSTNKKRCWKGNNWCHTHIPKKKCEHPKRCHKTVVIVTRRKN